MSAQPRTEADVAAFQALRPRLFGIALRILDSTAEADDVVQDAWLRWHRTDRTAVRSATAFLTTTTRRLSLNVADSGRVRHETRADAFYAEAVDHAADPAEAVERRDTLKHGLRLLDEHLSTPERTAYILREAFNYPYRRIGALLGVSEVNARQLVRRARGRLVDVAA